MNTLSELLKTQKLDIEILLNDYQIEINTYFKKLNDEIENLKENLKERDDKILKLSEEVKDNNFDKQNYQNVSMVRNLSKQIREKELELKTCNSQLRLAKKEIDTLKEKLELISEKDEIEDLQKQKSNVQLYIEEQSKLIEDTPTENNETSQILDLQEEQLKEDEKVKEDEKEEEKEKVEEEEEEEDEVSYVRKKIKGNYYFVSDEKPPQIYEYLEGNEVGALVGKMNNTKAEFFK